MQTCNSPYNDTQDNTHRIYLMEVTRRYSIPALCELLEKMRVKDLKEVLRPQRWALPGLKSVH
ncbi:hypothetical protein EYF80_056151 [Liparis tanakae]|uniref:Uncharacterized protein n=1 Tax=Liparis tanakae TaxID=230148 RepID=A0A4Z2EXL8_9TELE|nr:hypothetical protein EYF80_056151 [Liparis tanakae]